MTTLRRQAAYAAGVIAVVSGIIGMISWWLPSSATWLNKHGFTAWPLAVLFLILFVWSASNWYRAEKELASTRAASQELVPEDKRLYEAFKRALPKESNVLYWLRTRAESRSYQSSDVRPLSSFASEWRSSDHHFVNVELEEACQNFVQAASDFLRYQALHSHWAPQSMQINTEDPVFFVYDYDGKERPIQQGLGTRADKVLEAHNDFYMLGSRLGL